MKRALKHFIFRRRFRGKQCSCGIPIAWSKLRKHNQRDPVCWLHETYASNWHYHSIHKGTDLEKFRMFLNTNERMCRIYVKCLFNLAFKKGEEFVKVLLGTYFYRQLMKPVWSSVCKYQLTASHLIDCLQKGMQDVSDILLTWPSVQNSLQKGLSASCLRFISHANPLLRQALRSPVFELSLAKYFKDHTFDTYNNCIWKDTSHCPCKKLAANYINTICQYNWATLAFWVRVKTKVRAWKIVHGFASLPPFESSADSLPILIRRNPRRVPNAAEEFEMAAKMEPELIETSYVDTNNWKTWLVWLSKNSPHLLSTYVLGIYGKSFAGIELAKLFQNQAIYSFPNSFFLRAARFLKRYPIDREDSRRVFDTLLNCLHMNTDIYTDSHTNSFTEIHTGVICKVLETLVSLTPPSKGEDSPHSYLMQNLQTNRNFQKYLKDVYVCKTVVELCLTDEDCIRMKNQYQPYENEQLIMKTSYFQSRFKDLENRSQERLTSFLLKACHILRIRIQKRKAYIQQTMALHMHAWQTLIIRYRYIHSYLTNQDCPICMESHKQKRILHKERRHFVCVTCFPNISSKNCCPYCRAALTSNSKHKNVIQYYELYDNYESHDESDWEQQYRMFQYEMRRSRYGRRRHR